MQKVERPARVDFRSAVLAVIRLNGGTMLLDDLADAIESMKLRPINSYQVWRSVRQSVGFLEKEKRVSRHEDGERVSLTDLAI